MIRLNTWAIVAALVALAGCASPNGKGWIRHGFAQTCLAEPAFIEAARANAESLETLPVSPFGADETGWLPYAPKVAVEIAAGCAPESSAFAGRLARWQARHGLAPDGRMSAETLGLMARLWQARRPFLAARAAGTCPASPPEAALVHAGEDEAVMEKPTLMAPQTLEALTRMRADARHTLGLKPNDPLLMAFSAWRSPISNDERCAREGDCDGLARAQCSAHRTGLALDLFLGAGPRFDPDSTAPENRVFLAGTPAYRWLTARAGRYGFVNYAYEPWHWEWTGETPP